MYNIGMKSNIKKIAIVRLSALGDIINSAVVLQFIKQNYKNAEIVWITEEVFAPLLKNHKDISKVCSVNLKKLKKERSLSVLKDNIKKLNSLGEFDIIIDMQGLIKSAIVARIIGKNTHGFDKNSSREPLSSLFYKTTSHIAYDENIIKRNTFLVADALNFTIDDNMLLNKKRVFDFKKIDLSSNGKKNIALVIGASWESKKYPKEKFVEICKSISANFFIIWGDKREKEDAIFINSLTTNSKVAPKLSLDELVSYISNMDLVIGNDTGPTHLAWAQNVASITIFGPTNTRMIYQTPKNIAIESDSEVNIFKINKDDYSIKNIPPQCIVESVKGLIDGI